MGDHITAFDTTTEPLSTDYDLIVLGGAAGGMSVAISSLRSGLRRVRVIEPSAKVSFAELVPENQVEVGYGEQVMSVDIDPDSDGSVVLVVTDQRSYRTRACLVALRQRDPDWLPPIPVQLSQQVTVDTMPEALYDLDILVVGFTNHATELVAEAAAAGAGVVFASGGLDPAQLAPSADAMLRRLERERRITVLYRAIPDEIGQSGEFPIAYFKDRRTPDLEFDHIVFASERCRSTVDDLHISQAAICLLYTSDAADE